MKEYIYIFQISASELCFFKGRVGYLVLVVHLTPFIANEVNYVAGILEFCLPQFHTDCS